MISAGGGKGVINVKHAQDRPHTKGLYSRGNDCQQSLIPIVGRIFLLPLESLIALLSHLRWGLGKEVKQTITKNTQNGSRIQRNGLGTLQSGKETGSRGIRSYTIKETL